MYFENPFAKFAIRDNERLERVIQNEYSKVELAGSGVSFQDQVVDPTLAIRRDIEKLSPFFEIKNYRVKVPYSATISGVEKYFLSTPLTVVDGHASLDEHRTIRVTLSLVEIIYIYYKGNDISVIDPDDVIRIYNDLDTLISNYNEVVGRSYNRFPILEETINTIIRFRDEIYSNNVDMFTYEEKRLENINPFDLGFNGALMTNKNTSLTLVDNNNADVHTGYRAKY